MQTYLTRQSDLIPTQQLNQEIHVIGVGAIGSFVVLSLTKMGFNNITVYDDDVVDDVNMCCQFYRYKDIGKKKVDALRDMIKDFTGTEITVVPRRYESGKLSGIIITAVDSMAVRQNVWEQHANEDSVSYRTKYIIDPRMSAEYATMFVMSPIDAKDRKSYKHTLFSDDDGVQERCTAKATMYTVGMISGLVCKAMKDIINDAPYPRISTWNIADDSLTVYKKGVDYGHKGHGNQQLQVP